MTFSFQKRLLLGVMLLVVIITATLAFVGVRFGSSFLRTRFDDRMHFLARHLALNSELGILLGDRAMLKKITANILSENDVVRVWIEDEKGNIIFKAGEEQTRQSKEVVASVVQREQEEDQAFIYNRGGNKLLGKAHLVYSTSGIDSLLIKLRNLYIITGMGSGLIGLLFFFFFSRSLVAPLKDLVKATKLVTKGNLNAKVKEGSIPEIQHLAHAFNNMLTALEMNRKKLNEVHRQITEQKALAEVGLFSLTVAHEVKNPLGIIKGALDVLKKTEVDTETKSTMITYMDEEILRLDRLIQDFLGFSRPQQPDFKEVDLDSLIKNIIERNKLEWGNKGIVLHCKISQTKCIVRADEDLLSQAILNVLRNGCQACGDKGSVDIISYADETSCTLEIRDTGKGMPNKVKKKALEPFFTTKATGTGLGLAFVDRVMRVHNASIIISDNKHGGTVVKLVFKKVISCQLSVVSGQFSVGSFQ